MYLMIFLKASLCTLRETKRFISTTGNWIYFSEIEAVKLYLSMNVFFNEIVLMIHLSFILPYIPFKNILKFLRK